MSTLARCCCLMLVCVAALQVTFASEPSVSFAFGPYEKTLAGLAAPQAAVFDDAGRLYVAEAGAGQIRVYDKNGRFKRRLSAWGDGPKQLREPAGLVWVGKGLWVTDRASERLRVFNRKGRLRRQFVPRANGKSLFRAGGLAFDKHRERIAVADTGNGRVLLLNRAGAVLGVYDTTAEGQRLLAPVAVAFDDSGTLYVVDRDGNRIARFSEDGAPQPSWGGYGPFFGLLDEPSAAQWHQGNLWVVDRRNHRLQAFHPAAGPVTLWGEHEIVPHSGNGKLHYPDVLAIAPDGKKAVVGEALEHRLQVFKAAEQAPLVQEVQPATGMRERTHFGAYLGLGNGLLVIAEPENHFVFVFDLRRELPVIINKFGERGEGFGLMNRLAGLAILAESNQIACLDSANRKLSFFQLNYDPKEPMRFDPYRVQFAWALDFAAFEKHNRGQRPVELRVVQRAAAGVLHLLDGANGQIFQVDMDSGEVALVFPKAGSSAMRDPVDMVLDSARKRWLVTDQQAACVWSIDTGSGATKALGERGSGRGQFLRPFGIALNAKGEMLVSDSLRDRVLRLDEQGTLLAEWGGRGDRMGQFWNPRGVGIDRDGRIFVIDQGNHRAQIFSPEGTWSVTFGAGRAYNARNVPPEKRPLEAIRGNSPR